MKLVVIILSGGAGSRLWPVSREEHPKPFIRLGDGESLLQKTFLRGASLQDTVEVLTVTNRELFFKTEDEFRKVNHSALPTSFILEPFGRNTAPAIAAATHHVSQVHGEDTAMLVLAADHIITDQAAFAKAVEEATRIAQEGKLVTFGIVPEAPETGYGYIEANGTEVLRFVEKPSLDKAREYISSGRYYWNSGMFCFTARTMIQEMGTHCPDVLTATRRCLENAQRSESKGYAMIELKSADFAGVPDISVDYAVMESSKQMAVVPCRIGWSDIGSWTALGDLTHSDEAGNRVQGEALLRDSHNCYIQSPHRLTGVIGVDNLVIVDTPDALLVANRDRAQEVKYLYSELKARGHEAHKLHRCVNRPWGTYTVLEEGAGFKIKRIEVKPGASLSLQLHHHRSEHWIVVSGMARVINGDTEMFVGTNESTYIAAGHPHRLENPGLLDLVMIEVQSGQYLGEDDIVRLEDTYGRAS